MPKLVRETTPPPSPPGRTFLIEFTERELQTLYVLSRNWEGSLNLPKEHAYLFPIDDRLWEVVPDDVSKPVEQVSKSVPGYLR